MKPKFTAEFEHLMTCWLERVAELHNYALDLIDLGPEALASGEMPRMVELVNRIDDVTDALITTGDTFSGKLGEMVGAPVREQEVTVATDDLDSVPLDMSLPSIVIKKPGLLN